jgi:hypothetical protein
MPPKFNGYDTFEDLFWSKIDVRGEDECWEWQGGRDWRGYGAGYKDRKHIRAHRVAYELLVGPVPNDLEVCHKCDNPPCCNPAHLFLGTHKENMYDMLDKGRHSFVLFQGEDHGNAKLTDEQIAEIRTMYEQGGVRQVDLASRFGVSQRCISLIVRREAWTHIP